MTTVTLHLERGRRSFWVTAYVSPTFAGFGVHRSPVNGKGWCVSELEGARRTMATGRTKRAAEGIAAHLAATAVSTQP